MEDEAAASAVEVAKPKLVGPPGFEDMKQPFQSPFKNVKVEPPEKKKLKIEPKGSVGAVLTHNESHYLVAKSKSKGSGRGVLVLPPPNAHAPPMTVPPPQRSGVSVQLQKVKDALSRGDIETAKAHASQSC